MIPSDKEVNLGQSQISMCDREMRSPTSSNHKHKLGHLSIFKRDSEVSLPIPLNTH